MVSRAFVENPVKRTQNKDSTQADQAPQQEPDIDLHINLQTTLVQLSC